LASETLPQREWRIRNLERVRAAKRASYAANPRPYIEKAKAYAEKYPERVRAQARQAASVRRAIKRLGVGVKLRAGLVWELLEKQGNACVYCRESIAAATCHIDHIMPLSRGGEHVESNMQATCARCNKMKSNKLPDDFARIAKGLFG
jgi:5-methylcytosine-specific restriction endonuclease McrA